MRIGKQNWRMRLKLKKERIGYNQEILPYILVVNKRKVAG
jgi:hypothetical protein